MTGRLGERWLETFQVDSFRVDYCFFAEVLFSDSLNALNSLSSLDWLDLSDVLGASYISGSKKSWGS